MLFQKAEVSVDQTNFILKPGETVFTDNGYIKLGTLNIEGNLRSLSLEIHPKKRMILHKVRYIFSHPFEDEQAIFCNGYQSWTESREFRVEEKMRPLRKIAERIMQPYGDYGFCDYPEKAGYLHSWTYAYIRRNQGSVLLIGSLNERSGFTRISFQCPEHQIVVEKDCEGQMLEHSFPALEICWGEGQEEAIFDRYFEAMELQPRSRENSFGWTSWYNYYTDISETIILDNLKAFQARDKAVHIFQIDDGYQQAVGDWLLPNQKFPSGMQALARAIHQTGSLAGIWLAPFICEKASEIYKTHPDWLLRDKAGNPVKAGYAPHWSGIFYALDVYNAGFRKYLEQVFSTLFEVWGFDLVKLDFLYAAALYPPENKNRGIVMAEAMEFLDRLCKGKKILACGVPLGSAFGRVDYCRIGADIHLKWDHKLLAWLRNRERVSTKLALTNSLYRRHLDGRAFINDPDVFILRKNKHKLSAELLQSILLINAICGGLLFVSDFVGDYSNEQWADWEKAKDWQKARILALEGRYPHLNLLVEKQGVQYQFLINLSPSSFKDLENKEKPLLPFETRIKMMAPKANDL